MTQTQGLTSGMRPVKPDAIEKELDNLWREANANALASGGYAGSRNSVMTLVVYTRDDAQASNVLHIVESLANQHPSRAIVVVAQPGRSESAVEAYIATHQERTAGAGSYGEEILLKATDGTARHLPGTVLPLIVSGLPSFLWWTGEPPWGTEQLEALVDGSDRFILDTSEMTQPEQSLVALDDLVRRKASSCAVSDFNWTRANPWRELVAQFFDGEELRPYLNGIDTLTIEYAAGGEDAPTNHAQAYMFAGWLASRLNWRIMGGGRSTGSADRQHTLFDGTNRPITLELTPRFNTKIKSWLEIVPQGGHEVATTPGTPGAEDLMCVGPGALMSIHLHARVDGRTGTFTVARESDMQHASTLCQVTEAAPPAQTVHLPSLGELTVLAEQLMMLTPDAVYEDALTMAAQLVGPRSRRAQA